MKDIFELERRKVEWYQEFYRKNQHDFDHNKNKFFHEQRKYVEEKSMRYRYGL